MNISQSTTENVFYKARSEAAKTNDRLAGREGAGEELGIDKNRLARIELGVMTPYPEEVVLMAAASRAPHLRMQYCKHMCPLGKNFPEVQDDSLDRISLEALRSFSKVKKAKKLLLEITADGIIEETEEEDLKTVIETLEEMGRLAQQLKCWREKNL